MNEASKETITILEKEGFYLSTPSGSSMRPVICGGKDQTLIVPLVGKAKKGDVLLYEDAKGAHVLHRVIKVTENGYLLRGDNRYYSEAVPFDKVIGILSAIFKGDKKIDCQKSIRYRLYSKRRMLTYPLRRAVAALRRIGRKYTRHSP